MSPSPSSRSSRSARFARARELLEQANCNLSPEHKEIIARAGAAFNSEGHFADSIMMQTRMIECTTFVRPEDGSTQARVVLELVVAQGASSTAIHAIVIAQSDYRSVRIDMCNAHGMMHGGCSAYLVDQLVPRCSI